MGDRAPDPLRCRHWGLAAGATQVDGSAGMKLAIVMGALLVACAASSPDDTRHVPDSGPDAPPGSSSSDGAILDGAVRDTVSAVDARAETSRSSDGFVDAIREGAIDVTADAIDRPLADGPIDAFADGAVG